MPFDTRPGDTPLPVLHHTLHDCVCCHADELHENVETTEGTETKNIVICFECDADED